MFEENELLKEKLILTSLLDDGLITDIEYRTYLSDDNFAKRRAAILEIILSKYKQEPTSVLEICQRLTSANDNPGEDSNLHFSDGHSIESNSNGLSIGEVGKNPLLNDAILQCMFELLPLKYIKTFRLVCRQWNFIAGPCLRKKSRVHFTKSSLVPKKFIDISQHTLPNLPFTSFRFSSSCYYESFKWKTSDLIWFFEKWGKNIKELNLDKIIISCNRELYISSWLKGSINLSKLTISTGANLLNDSGFESSQITRIEINFESLASTKSLSLTNCTVVLPCTHKQVSRHVVDSEITLDGVRFIEREEKSSKKVLQNVCLNDFIDFSRAAKISVTNRTDTIFDMKCQIFNSQHLRLQEVKIVNFEQARGKLESFHTSDDFLEAIQLEIEELRITRCRVNLCVLPYTIKKLSLENCEIICDFAIQFPDLQFASFKIKTGGRENQCEIVWRFAACQNLVELEIGPDNSCSSISYDFDVKLIPRSVKRMKITRINLIGRKITLNLDVLIVEVGPYCKNRSFFTSAAGNISEMNLKVKTLVVTCIPSNYGFEALGSRIKYFWEDAFDTSDAKEILRLNKTFKNIVVGTDLIFDEKEECDQTTDTDKESDDEEECDQTPDSGEKNDGEERVDFSTLVDRKANYYLFQNQRGKALLQEEFEEWKKMNGLKMF